MLRTMGGGISIVILLFFLSCHQQKEKKERVDNIIDRSYLKSGSFKSFQKQTHTETRRSIRQEHQFRRFVQNVLKNENVEPIRAPAVIDKDRIEKVLKDDRNESPRMTAAFGRKQLYHRLYKIEGNGRYYHFFIMCKIASYDNCLIWLATTQKNKMNDLQMIALYNRAPVFHEAPFIQVAPPDIRVETNRLVKYPIKMQNSYKLNYKVTGDGHIYRIIKE